MKAMIYTAVDLRTGKDNQCLYLLACLSVDKKLFVGCYHQTDVSQEAITAAVNKL